MRPSLLVTPQNRFGRQGAAYLAAWCTDVAVGHEGRARRPGDHAAVPGLRGAPRAPRRVAQPPDARVLRSVGSVRAASRRSGPVSRNASRRALIHRADRLPADRASSGGSSSRRPCRRGSSAGVNSHRTSCTCRRRQRDYRCEGYGDYLFAVSRLTPHKRLDLLLRALAEPSAAGIRCVIAGEGGELDALQAAPPTAGSRRPRRLRRPAWTRPAWSTTSRGAAPWRSRRSTKTTASSPSKRSAVGKAVITCRDSGGPAELVRDGVNGYVTEPKPEALARAMRQVMDDRTTRHSPRRGRRRRRRADDVARRGGQVAALRHRAPGRCLQSVHGPDYAVDPALP